MSESSRVRWIEKQQDGFKWWSIMGRECEITIEARPGYCDRGNYIAKLFATGALEMDLDHADAWPRYYFYLPNAFAECEAWLRKRRQWIDSQPPPPIPQEDAKGERDNA